MVYTTIDLRRLYLQILHHPRISSFLTLYNNGVSQQML